MFPTNGIKCASDADCALGGGWCDVRQRRCAHNATEMDLAFVRCAQQRMDPTVFFTLRQLAGIRDNESDVPVAIVNALTVPDCRMANGLNQPELIAGLRTFGTCGALPLFDPAFSHFVHVSSNQVPFARSIPLATLPSDSFFQFLYVWCC